VASNSVSPDWKRAIYIDFEGRVKDPESILGYSCEGVWGAFVIEESLWPAALLGHLRGEIKTSLPVDALNEIQAIAKSEQRVVACWSEREIGAISGTPGISAEQENWWRSHLVNAKEPAKKMARALGLSIAPRQSRRGGGPNRNPLSSYMSATGYVVPPIHGPDNAAQRILYMRNQLLLKGSVELVSRAAKTKWTNGLSHNYHDCVGLGHVMMTLARWIEESNEVH